MEDDEDVRRRLAELSAEVEMLKWRYTMCLEAVAKLREELESVKRKVRGISGLKGYVKALEVGSDEREPP